MAAPLVTREMINSQTTDVTGGTGKPEMLIRDVKEFIPLMADVNADFIKSIPTIGEQDMLKYEWGEGDLTPSVVTATAAALDTDQTITVDHPEYLQQYDLLYNLKTGETLRVTQEPGATATVVRGHGGSTKAAITIGDEFRVLGPAVPEGADTPDSPTSQGSLDFNYPQIFEYSWKITHRGNVTPTYEFKSPKFKEMVKRGMKEAARDLNRVAYLGLRSAGDASGTNPSTTGGARQFAKANVVDKNGAPFEINDFLDLLQKQYEDVGGAAMAKQFYMNIKMKRILNSFLNPLRRANVSDAKLNLTLDKIETDFGDITVKTDTEFLDGEMQTFNFSDLGRYAYKGGSWKTGMFSTDGWYDRGFLRGDFGFKWAAPRRRGAIFGISTDLADYPDYNVVGP